MPLSPEKITEKYCYGQKMIRKRSLSGKQDVAYIVTHTSGYDTVVKMAPELPYESGKDKHFFVHIEKLLRLWHHAKEGIQTKLFN